MFICSNFHHHFHQLTVVLFFPFPVSQKMPEIQLGSHTVRSHGIKVLRIHMHDWLILLVLAAIDLGLNLIEPFHRFVGEDMMTDLKYPLKDNTVPFWGVPVRFGFKQTISC